MSAPTPPGPICPDRPGVCAPRPDAGRPFLPAARAALPAAGAARAARPLRCAPGAGPLRARAALRSRLLGSSVPPRRAARPQPRRSLGLPRAGGGTRGRGRAGERGTEGGSARGRGAGRCSGSPPSPGRGAARRPPPAPRPLPALPPARAARSPRGRRPAASPGSFSPLPSPLLSLPSSPGPRSLSSPPSSSPLSSSPLLSFSLSSLPLPAHPYPSRLLPSPHPPPILLLLSVGLFPALAWGPQPACLGLCFPFLFNTDFPLGFSLCSLAVRFCWSVLSVSLSGTPFSL